MPEQDKGQTKKPENLSFEALSREMGDVTEQEPVAQAPPDRQPAPSTSTAFAELAAKAPSEPKPRTKAGGTGFSDLAADDVLVDARPYAVDDEPPEPIEETREEADGESIEDRLNARVLSASAPKPKPLWFHGIFVAILVLVGVYALSQSEYQARPLEVLLRLLGIAAVLWSAYGLMKSKEKKDRIFSAIAMLLGISATVAAFTMLGP